MKSLKIIAKNNRFQACEIFRKQNLITHAVRKNDSRKKNFNMNDFYIGVATGIGGGIVIICIALWGLLRYETYKMSHREKQFSGIWALPFWF